MIWLLLGCSADPVVQSCRADFPSALGVCPVGSLQSKMGKCEPAWSASEQLKGLCGGRLPRRSASVLSHQAARCVAERRGLSPGLLGLRGELLCLERPLFDGLDWGPTSTELWWQVESVIDLKPHSGYHAEVHYMNAHSGELLSTGGVSVSAGP